MLRRYIVISLLAILLAVSYCAFANVSTSHAATGEPKVSYQAPQPNGQETLWVNVTRWLRGKPNYPTSGLLKSIIDSYRSGGWRPIYSPVKDADGTWWQKLVRTAYTNTSGMGAGVIITWYWYDGCPVNKWKWEPGLGGSSYICNCWKYFSAYYQRIGQAKPEKCY